VGLLGAALISEPWATLTVAAVIYAAVIPFSIVSYRKARRLRAAVPRPAERCRTTRDALGATSNLSAPPLFGTGTRAAVTLLHDSRRVIAMTTTAKEIAVSRNKVVSAVSMETSSG
jgi:hypothetical protein